MNSLLKYKSVEANPLYNCSVPLENVFIPGTSRPLLGYGLIVFGIIVEIIYIPSLIAIVKRKLINFSCYKIMFCLGVLDMFSTMICTILSGVLFIEGAVFCTHPTLIYIAGCLGLGGWMMSCAFTLLLVINRVTDIIARGLAQFLFTNNRAWLMCTFPLAYGVYSIFFTPAIIFNSTIMAWIGDPGILEGHSADYRNHVQIYNNFVFIFSTLFFYTLYCFCMTKQQMGVRVKGAKQVFIQSSLICTINCSSATVYILLTFVSPDPLIVIVGELAWSLAHACPAFIYMTINQSVRQEVYGWVKKPERLFDVSVSRVRTLDSA